MLPLARGEAAFTKSCLVKGMFLLLSPLPTFSCLVALEVRCFELRETLPIGCASPLPLSERAGTCHTGKGFGVWGLVFSDTASPFADGCTSRFLNLSIWENILNPKPQIPKTKPHSPLGSHFWGPGARVFRQPRP